ncbi:MULTISPECIES: GNAT family N-acyltransferase [unclassified Beijerinckia]|uniref:GNAT family N-acetyltransferase n=1 Tax=unclassified Beijerinckia TaxID=2638183 RepID=UPI00089CD712|nr:MULTISPECIES: GNAT family N-acyltransferase [unclassified Beijerinckia]MDH7797717.1 putative hemolysin [Beijerinckia sp. GAS462]SEC96074.1 ornithine-acyl[acyl carrier protein] N-acyltransferase [Beijerinckia sp. 28-YEA-48]
MKPTTERAGGQRFAGFVSAFAVQRRVVRDLHGLPESLARVGSLELKFAVTKKEIRKAQRLRYRVFFDQGSAQPDRTTQLRRRDVCPFDVTCDHLIVVDHAAKSTYGRIKPKVVGTYRLLRQNARKSDGGFYSAQEFDVAPLLARHAGKHFLELGRSCVLPEYRARRTLELLWRGIWMYVSHHNIDVMIGCASFDTVNPAEIAAPLSLLHHKASVPEDWMVRALDDRRVDMAMLADDAISPRRALAALPTLIKGYLRLGAMIGDGAVIDHQFGTTDVLIVLPVANIDDRYIDHFGGGHPPVNEIAA